MKEEIPPELKDIPPPRRKATSAILDFHVHVSDMPETEHLVRSMELYGIETAVAVTIADDLSALRERYSGRFLFCLPLDFSHPASSKTFIEGNVALIASARQRGVVAIKLWFQPRLMAKHKLKISDAKLQPLFDAMSDNNLLALVHIADPDVWYEKYYADPAVYGTKQQHHAQLESFLSKNAKLTVVCAHLGGDPEHLEQVAQLLDSHPNLYLDTSATKWVTRELSKRPRESREFLIKYAGRVVFGTDNYVLPETDLRHYCLRYYVHRTFWETDNVFTSPIPDPDTDGSVHLTGLNLPKGVLEQIYFKNARALLKLS